MARTTYPSRCKRSISPLQLEASAQAPCTKTMVGFTPQLGAVAGARAGAVLPAAVTDDGPAAGPSTTPRTIIATTIATATSTAMAAGPRPPHSIFIAHPPVRAREERVLK